MEADITKIIQSFYGNKRKNESCYEIFDNGYDETININNMGYIVIKKIWK